MTQHQIRARVREYVTDNFLYMRQGYEFSDGDSLLGHGIVDSMGVIELITFVQDQFGVEVAEEEITEENFGTLHAIGCFVEAKQRGQLTGERNDPWSSPADDALDAVESTEAVTESAD